MKDKLSGISNSLEVKKALIKASEKGIDTPDCVAYHFTTIESLQYVITYGGFPGDTNPFWRDHFVGKEAPCPGDLYFFPRPSVFPFEVFQQQLPDIQEDLKGSTDESLKKMLIGSASALARNHRFAGLVNTDISLVSYGSGFWNWTSWTEDGVFYDISDIDRGSVPKKNPFNITREQLGHRLKQSLKRRGFLAGLKREVLELYTLKGGDYGADFRINVWPDGLHPMWLSGLVALGPAEEKFIKKLKNDLIDNN